MNRVGGVPARSVANTFPAITRSVAPQTRTKRSLTACGRPRRREQEMNGHGLYQAAPDAVRPISIGILLDGRIQERWVLECARQVLTVPGVRLTSLALASPSPLQSFAARLHSLFDLLDERLRCRGERLLAPTDVAKEVALPPLQVDVSHKNGRWGLDETGIDALRRCEVDLWLCFVAAPPHRLPRSVSRLGAWGVERVGRGHGGGLEQPGDDGQYRRLRGGRRWLAVPVIWCDGR